MGRPGGGHRHGRVSDSSVSGWAWVHVGPVVEPCRPGRAVTQAQALRSGASACMRLWHGYCGGVVRGVRFTKWLMLHGACVRHQHGLTVACVTVARSASAKLGKSVLQLDPRPHYGGPWASLSLDALLQVVEGADAHLYGISDAVVDRFQPDALPGPARSPPYSLDISPKVGVAWYPEATWGIHVRARVRELCAPWTCGWAVDAPSLR